VLLLRKLHRDYDPHNKIAAMNYITKHQAEGEVVTGLLYVDNNAQDLHEHLNTIDIPLNTLTAKDLNPGKAALDKINQRLR
ncbi:MAG TPA: 2-oxoacid:ferredoxin oxidoreductase subunit beta, partial [Pseudomonadota bacterium]|nr:2-oxoacid:ferredoxin oxidoreductase subunit beta [Pseudomonadota bacterium]